MDRIVSNRYKEIGQARRECIVDEKSQAE